MPSRARLNAEGHRALFPLPNPQSITRVPIRQTRLTENGVLKRKPGFVVLLGFNRVDEAAVNTAHRVGFPHCSNSGKVGNDAAQAELRRVARIVVVGHELFPRFLLAPIWGAASTGRGRCRRKIEMSPGAQSRDDTPGGDGHDQRLDYSQTPDRD